MCERDLSLQIGLVIVLSGAAKFRQLSCISLNTLILYAGIVIFCEESTLGGRGKGDNQWHKWKNGHLIKL